MIGTSDGSRTVLSWEGPGTEQDRTEPRDLEGPVVQGLKKSKSPGTFLKVPELMYLCAPVLGTL